MARSRRRRPRSVWPLAALVGLAAIGVAALTVLAVAGAQHSPSPTTGPRLTPAAATARASGSLPASVSATKVTTPAATPASTPATPTAAPSAAAHAWAGLRATTGQVWMGDMTLTFFWPGGMLARGYDSPFMKYSGDGKSWTAVGETATFGNESGLMDGLVWNGAMVVATGQITSALAPKPVVWVSPDGRSWSQADTGGTFDPASRMAALAANTSAIVGVTADGQVWRSADGRAWTHTALPGSAGTRIVQAAATTKAFVVVGLNGGDGAAIPNKGVTVWSSADGKAWRSKVITTQQWAWEKVFVLGDAFVAYEGETPEAATGAAQDAKQGWQSSNGYDWTTLGPSPAGFDVVGSSGSILVAQQRMTVAGAPLVLKQSIDGVHWTSLPIEVPATSALGAAAVAPSGVFISVAPLGARQYFEAVP